MKNDGRTLREWAEELDEMIRHPDIDDPAWILDQVRDHLEEMPDEDGED